MKFLLVAFALVGIAAAASLPDSATQGPNPQDIATPEPEYIDIDLPEAAPAPKVFSPAPRPIQRPHQAAAFSAPISQQQFQPQLQQPQYQQPQFQQPQYQQPQYQQTQYQEPQYQQPQLQQSQLPGHILGQSGYQYRRPVYVRRVYRRRY